MFLGETGVSVFRYKKYVEIIPLSKIVCTFSKMGDYDAKWFCYSRSAKS